jgi:hypothetical protein
VPTGLRAFHPPQDDNRLIVLASVPWLDRSCAQIQETRACAAVGLVGRESDLFRFTVKHSLLFAVIIGIITYVQAYFLSWMIPVVAHAP